MLVSIIAAMDRCGLIGDETGLPWHLPKDLRRFRAYTWGKPVILGRRTFELIGKPLPGRFSIVLSQYPDYSAPGCGVARTFQQALSIAEKHLTSTGGDEVMIIGGGKVYAEAINRWDRLYLTIVEGQFKGTTYFPVRELLQQSWRPACKPEMHPADEKNQYALTFHIIDRTENLKHLARQLDEDNQPQVSGDSERTLDGLDLASFLSRGHSSPATPEQ